MSSGFNLLSKIIGKYSPEPKTSTNKEVQREYKENSSLSGKYSPEPKSTDISKDTEIQQEKITGIPDSVSKSCNHQNSEKKDNTENSKRDKTFYLDKEVEKIIDALAACADLDIDNLLNKGDENIINALGSKLSNCNNCGGPTFFHKSNGGLCTTCNPLNKEGCVYYDWLEMMYNCETLNNLDALWYVIRVCEPDGKAKDALREMYHRLMNNFIGR